MIKKAVFSIIAISAMSFTQAAVDWTPKLTGLQDSCSDTFHIMEELPKKYQASISKRSEQKIQDEYSGNNITTTYHLKDAIFFGLPLEALKEDVNDTDFHYKKFSMVFKDTAFMQLRPSFYYVAQSDMGMPYVITADNPKSGKYQNVDEGIDVTYKNTVLGYEIEDNSSDGMSCSTYLDFDKANKTLSCASACG